MELQRAKETTTVTVAPFVIDDRTVIQRINFAIQPPISPHAPDFLFSAYEDFRHENRGIRTIENPEIEDIAFTFSDKTATYGQIIFDDVEDFANVQKDIQITFQRALNPLGLAATKFIFQEA